MMEYYGWLVPLGALVVAIGGIAFIHVSSRRLERQYREDHPAE